MHCEAKQGNSQELVCPRDASCLYRPCVEWHEVKEIVSGMALATGIVAQRFPMQEPAASAVPLTSRTPILVPFDAGSVVWLAWYIINCDLPKHPNFE